MNKLVFTVTVDFELNENDMELIRDAGVDNFIKLSTEGFKKELENEYLEEGVTITVKGELQNHAD